STRRIFAPKFRNIFWAAGFDCGRCRRQRKLFDHRSHESGTNPRSPSHRRKFSHLLREQVEKYRLSSTPIQIRPASAGDAPAIATLLRESFIEYESLYTAAGFAATAITPEQVIDRLSEG